MTYIAPGPIVYQDFAPQVTAVLHPLTPHMSGPHAWLVRYAQSSEKALGALGYYDWLDDTVFSWPNQPATSLLDPTYTKLFIDQALLRYYQATVSGGQNIRKVTGKANQIRSSVISFSDNGTDYPHDTQFLDRGVKVGDIARVRATVSSVTYTLWTYVNGFIGEAIAAAVGAATSGASNKGAQSASTSIVQLSGAQNCVDPTASGTSYDGRVSGYITETYTVVVTQGSVNGLYTTAKVRVISASGTDDQASVVPAIHGQPTSIGTRGLTVTFTTDNTLQCSDDATDADLSPTDLIVGQKWQITVNQLWAPVTPTSGGTYTGTRDMSYIVRVSRGGLYAASPQITVTTTDGSDISGPTTVSATNTFVSIGNYGAQIKFSGTALVAGDVYVVPVTAPTVGEMQTIVLGNNFNPAVTDNTEVELTLFIRRESLQISENRVGAAPLVNWSQTLTNFTVQSGITAFDSSWTDSGTPVALPVVSDAGQGYGAMFVEYRAWQSTLCNTFNVISDIADLDTMISGANHPDNPLKYMVGKCLANANGANVAFSAVCDPDDVNSWNRVLELIGARNDVYGLVPYTHDPAVQSLYQAHVNDASGPTSNLWRVVWFAANDVTTKNIVSSTLSTDGETVLATITDDPDTDGTQYTLVTVPASNSNFISNHVTPGDIVRIQYTGDGFGGTVYSSYVVARVLSEESLLLTAGPDAALDTPQKLEIWRNLDATSEAAAIGLQAGAFGDHRVRMVWPSTAEADGYSVDGIFVAAALAGLRAGVVPHQGLTRLPLAGFTSVNATSQKFNKAQLDSMAASGVLIVMQDLQVGTIFARHAVTTGPTTLDTYREEMYISNADSISYRFKEEFEPFIGITNVTPSLLLVLRDVAKTTINVLKGELFTTLLGGQLISGTVVQIAQHALLRDRVVAILSLRLPFATNNIEIHLQL